MKRLKNVFLLLVVVFSLSACAPALQMGAGLIGESLVKPEKQKLEKDNSLSSRKWDPGKKKYYRYDKDYNKIYE